MVGRLVRVTGTVLVIAVALVTPVLATSTPASADTVVDGCTIVANPTSTNFTNCPGVSFAGANLSGLNLSFANLDGARFVDPGGSAPTSCGDANCDPADLSGANLTDANLSSTTFVAAGFWLDLTTPHNPPCVGAAEAQCVELAYGWANLNGATLSGANATGATFGSCITISIGGSGPSTGCLGATLTNANLTGATLTGANLTGTVLVPQGQTVAATSAGGAVVSWPTPAGLPGAAPGSCTPSSGSTFPVGTTTVTCQVLDTNGDVATGTFTVIVNPPPPPTTVVGIPSNGATVSEDTWLDAGASSPVGIASVNFEVSGGPNSISDQVVGSGTGTYYGYIGGWDTRDVPNGTYSLQSVATDTTGVSTTSAPITVTVNNGPLSTSVIIPANGFTVDTAQTYVLDAIASAGATAVSFEVTIPGFINLTIPATPTIYGWIVEPGGGVSGTPGSFSATIQSVATFADGSSVTSPAISGTIIVYTNGVP